MGEKELARNPGAFVRKLSGPERIALLRELLAAQPKVDGAKFTPVQLLSAERWFWRQAQTAAGSAQKHSRGRMWMIFMLLRYGGLRLKEVFALTEADCRFGEGRITINERSAPLSGKIARVLANFWNSWPGRAKEEPFLCDSSQIRRAFGICARACGIEPALLNARSLRRQRGLELESEGLHPALVAWFLGKTANPAPFGPAIAEALLTSHIQKEEIMKTSARNVFQGQIIELKETGILVSATLETPQGLKITSIITRTSRENLGLSKGKAVTALVKAPWVTLLPESQRAAAGTDNCFAGKVENMERDELACEIRVLLPEGNRVCALYANGASPSAEIRDGASVLVCFSAFAVILTAD